MPSIWICRISAARQAECNVSKARRRGKEQGSIERCQQPAAVVRKCSRAAEVQLYSPSMCHIASSVGVFLRRRVAGGQAGRWHGAHMWRRAAAQREAKGGRRPKELPAALRSLQSSAS